MNRPYVEIGCIYEIYWNHSDILENVISLATTLWIVTVKNRMLKFIYNSRYRLPYNNNITFNDKKCLCSFSHTFRRFTLAAGSIKYQMNVSREHYVVYFNHIKDLLFERILAIIFLWSFALVFTYDIFVKIVLLHR